jgi:hypothetical protein
MKMPKTSEMMASPESAVRAILHFFNKIWTQWKGVIGDSVCLMMKRKFMSTVSGKE